MDVSRERGLDRAMKIDLLIAEHLFGGDLKDYSTTWDGMGLVVEAMREREWAYYLYCLGPAYEPEAMFYRHRRGMDPPIGQGELADTAPMAVALIALRALGVEVPD